MSRCEDCEHSHGQCPQPGVVGEHWWVVPVNPTPWAVGALGMGRRGNRTYPTMGANQELVAYQEAVREHFRALGWDGEQDTDSPTCMYSGKYQIEFFYWRQREEYKTEKGRASRRHEADTTNLNKALEDALQGQVIHNDRDTVEITGFMAAQGPNVVPKVVIHLVVKSAILLDPSRIPGEVWDEIDFVDNTERDMLAPLVEGDPDDIPF